jgi:hypothetical protein
MANVDGRESAMSEETVRKSSPALIAVAWLIVLVPAGWGLTFTVQNALKIFQTGAAPAIPAAAK